MNSEYSSVLGLDETEKPFQETLYQKQMREQMEIYQQMEFHSKNTLMVKNRLGSKCSYLSWQRTGDDYGIKAVINGKKIEVALGGTPKDVEYEQYNDLFEKLNNYGEDK